MADISVIIEVLGEEDMIGATKAADRMSRQYAYLDKQLNKSKITAQQYAKGIAQVDARVNQLASSAGRVGGAMQQTARRTNQLGVLFQQTGYQVGDFAVQVQSGTHYMVALGQQATQLVGTFAMLSKSIKMIALFSGLGIVIPIATAVLGAWMRTVENSSEKSKDAEKEVSRLSDTIDKLNNVQKTTAVDLESGLNAAFEDSSTSVGKLLQRLKEAEFAAAMEPVERVTRQIEFNVDAAVSNYARLRQISSMTKLEKFFAGASEDDIRSMQALVQENINLVYAQEELRASLDKISQSKTTEGLIKNFSSALELAESIGGPAAEDIVQGLIAAAKEAGLYEEIMQRAEQASEDTADASAGIAPRIREAAKAATDLMRNLRGAMRSIGATEAGIAAAQRVAATGASEATVRATQAGAETEATLKAQGVSGAELQQAVAMASEKARREYLAREAETALYSKFDTSGGGASKPTVEKYLRQLQEEAKYKRSLVGLSEEEQRVQEIIYDAKQQELVVTEAQAKSVAELEEGTRKLIEAEDKRKAMMDMIEGNIEDAFMTMIDGSSSVEDAFKGMLRNILLEIYRQQVAKPIATGIGDLIGSFLGQANGGAWNKGVQMFADGGVVSAPTAFRHSGGLGVMGEAGPEAIMPLKRGKNGKLGVQMEGSQQPVVINQSFNFSANGDDSVKRIIAQEAPKIANLTQKQILDQRARGGAFRTTFG